MRITLTSPDGAQAQVTRNGAQVVSWIPANQSEQLFLSTNSSFKTGVAIRGGIPVIFPQFAGLGSLPKHGFARTQEWQLRSSTPSNQAVFELRDNPETRALWPHSFLAELTVTVSGDQLQVALQIHNCGTSEFSFTCALHTYFKIEHIDLVRVLGLQHCHYADSVTGAADCVQQESQLAIQGQLDRIYKNVQHPLEIQQPRQSINLQSSGFDDVVVWNPGAELGATIADLESQGYQRMLCVEAATIVKPVSLQPGASWQGSQQLIAVKK